MNKDMGLSHALALIKGILDDFPALVIVADYEGNIVYHNNEAERIMGKDLEQNHIGRLFLNAKTKTTSIEPNLEYEIGYNNHWYKASVAETIWINEEPAKVVVGLDITRIKTNERRLKVDATTDAMTGIVNRHTGFKFLEEFIQEVKDSRRAFTICYFDINDLKYTNDTFGHLEGDTYILSVVDAVKQSIRQSDVFARMGGDEFMVLFRDCPCPKAESIMCNVNTHLEKLAYESKNKDLHYSISYGVLEVDAESYLDSEAIFNAADNKMYCMKEEYRRTKKLSKL